MIRLHRHGMEFTLVPQVLYEYWVVYTRPRVNNGLGYSPAAALHEIDDLTRRYPLLADPPEIFDEWKSRVALRQVTGKQAHDARLVAAMAVHGLTRLLTFNPRHFARYPEIETIDPSTV